MSKLEIGAKVTYTDQKTGKKKTGIIHGIRKAEDSSGNEHIISYLVDTGNDTRVDEYRRDLRGEEIGRRATKHHEDGLDRETALEKAMSSKGLSAEGITIDRVRQPEQVDVRPADIQPL